MSVNNQLGYEGYPVPLGSIVPFMGQDANSLPMGWLFCDGRELYRLHYPELFAAIGYNYNLSTTTPGNFCLPDLSINDNYLFPSNETEPGGEGGLQPAAIKTDGSITLAANQIPSLSAANITTTYATTQVGFARGVTFSVRGDYGDYDASALATATPEIVKLDSTQEDSGTFELTSADYGFKNTTQKSITDIETDSSHGLQYGGMSCCYIIKVSSLLFDTPDGSLRKNIDDAAVAALQNAYDLEQQAAAKATQTTERDQEADTAAQNEADAIAANGQGGGTAVPYADVPLLSGFIIPPNP